MKKRVSHQRLTRCLFKRKTPRLKAEAFYGVLKKERENGRIFH